MFPRYYIDSDVYINNYMLLNSVIYYTHIVISVPWNKRLFMKTRKQDSHCYLHPFADDLLLTFGGTLECNINSHVTRIKIHQYNYNDPHPGGLWSGPLIMSRGSVKHAS